MAGLAGGVAEVVWIALFSGLSGGSAGQVAQGVTATVLPGLAGSAIAVPFGLAFHLILAAGLGIAVVGAVRGMLPGLARSWGETALVIGTLALIWALNFLVVLPVLNPDFVHVVPMAASFASKLLFGIAAAMMLQMREPSSET